MFLQEVPALKPACNNLLNPWSFLIHISHNPSVDWISYFVAPFTCVPNRKPRPWPVPLKSSSSRAQPLESDLSSNPSSPRPYQSSPVPAYVLISTRRSNSTRVLRRLGETASMRHRAKHMVSMNVGAILCRTPNAAPGATNKYFLHYRPLKAIKQNGSCDFQAQVKHWKNLSTNVNSCIWFIWIITPLKSRGSGPGGPQKKWAIESGWAKGHPSPSVTLKPYKYILKGALRKDVVKP